MFPIGDQDVVEERLSWVTYALIGINVLVFLFLEVPVMGDQAAFQHFVEMYGAVPAEIQQGQDLFTILTSMFLHGGWLHLISNMLFLWIFGDNIETVLGHIPYLIFYLLGGVVATGAHILFNLGSPVPSVGASGAISAILGAYIVMFPGNQVKMLILSGIYVGVTYISALFFLGLWALTQVINGIGSTVNTAHTSRVAIWAHIGGFVAGLIVGYLFRTNAAKLRVVAIRR
ncbi:MAG: rhomboid family intramembrane serine protease [Ardenticatenaceae bacterium]